MDRREKIHAAFQRAEADWMYNTAYVGPGASANDAPTTAAAVKRIAKAAMDNGCEPDVVAQWLETALNIVRDTGND